MKISHILLAVVFASSSAMASDNWVSGTNHLVRDSSGQCIRNGVWTPATAHPDCVPDLRPRAQPQPAPAPAPRVQAPAPQPAAPVVTPKAVQHVTFQAETLFDFDRSVIKPEGRRALDGFVTSVNGSRIAYDTVIVIGHTDNIGSDAYNQRLGMRRAEAVKAFLISRGIEANRIKTDSRGKREPIADNRTAQGRALNRRVEITIRGSR